MAITPERRAILEARIDALDEALFKLSIGDKRVKVAYDGESVDYTAADEEKMRRLIAEYRAEIAGTARRPGARRVMFA